MMAHGPIAAGLRLVAESDLAEGVSIAIAGLTIVFVALVLISLSYWLAVRYADYRIF